jgi:hypothetical protein
MADDLEMERVLGITFQVSAPLGLAPTSFALSRLEAPKLSGLLISSAQALTFESTALSKATPLTS